VNAVKNIRAPYNAGGFWSGCTTGGLSSSAQFRIANYTQCVGLLGRVISPLQGICTQDKQNKHRHASMPRVGFEPTTLVLSGRR
jgi:hypothetical protein